MNIFNLEPLEFKNPASTKQDYQPMCFIFKRETAQMRKFRKAREAKAARLRIENDKKRQAVNHPLN